MNDDLIDKMMELVLFVSILTEKNFKKNIADTKEKTAVVKEVVTDNIETLNSVNHVFIIISRIVLLTLAIYNLHINGQININTDAIAIILSLIIFIYSFIANIVFQENDVNQIGIGILSGSLLLVGLICIVIYINKDKLKSFFKKELDEQEELQTPEQKKEIKTKIHRYYINTLLILTSINEAISVSNTHPLVKIILVIIRLIVMSLYLVYLKRNEKIRFDKNGIDSTAAMIISTLISYISMIWDYFDINNTSEGPRQYTLGSTLLLIFLFFLYGVYTERKKKANSPVSD
jgi:hypothetical protein